MNPRERISSGFQFLDIPIIRVAGTEINLATLLLALLIILASLLVSRLARRAVTRLFAEPSKEDEGNIAAANRIIHYLVLFPGIGMALHTLGVNLTALFAAGALFAIAIGFAMQNIAANFVSGLILLVERAIKPGDIIDFEGQVVRVRDMGIRATVVRTLNDEDIIIPNSQLVQSPVRNYTFRDPLFRLRVPVGVSYGSDMRQVREVLVTTAQKLVWRSTQRDPVVLLSEFGNSSVEFEVSVWIEDPWASRRSRSDLREAMWFSLQEAGITIAFPQLDLHFDNPVTESFVNRKQAI